MLIALAVKSTLEDAFELVAQSRELLPRLEAAGAEIAKCDWLVDEKSWMEIAHRRLAAATKGVADDLVLRSLRLPELAGNRGEHAKFVQGAVVDALEHLHAAIIFVGGPRAALLEALYYKVKLPVLRKCDREELEAFWAEFEKRLGSTYARRILKDPDYAPAVAALEKLRAAYETWASIFVADPVSGPAADEIRAELSAAGGRLGMILKQSRLLAQAALAPLEGMDVAAMLALRAKKRGRPDDEDTHPLLENDPPDPRDPTAEERAELESARS